MLSTNPAGTRPHGDDPVGEDQGLLEVVRDEQHGLLQILQEVEEVVLHRHLGLGIERAEGLVHQEDLGINGQDPGDLGSLGHAPGELVREGVGELHEADLIEEPFHDGLPLGVRDAPQLEAETHVVTDCAPRQKCGLLERVACRPAHVPHRFAPEEHLSLVGLSQARHDIQQGGLPASRGADHGDELALGDLEGDIIKRLEASLGRRERLADVHDFQHRNPLPAITAAEPIESSLGARGVAALERVEDRQVLMHQARRAARPEAPAEIELRQRFAK